MKSVQKSLRKVLYVAMRYDYGKKEQGTSFEFNNFYKTLQRMVAEVIEFDFMTLMQEKGKDVMNQMLLETAERERPDLIFFCIFTDEIDKETIGRLSERWITYNWFCDDHWRFSNFSKHYAPHFTFVSTTDIEAMPKYEKIGYKNALLTQWACNHFDYVRKDDASLRYDVSFVGQPHGDRRSVVGFLEQNHVNIEAFGKGWKNGRVSQEEMILIFNESRINLNLSNSSWNIHTIFRRQQQIKGRNFEIPGCGGFLLTNHVKGLERYYRIGEEVTCFKDRKDLLKQVRHYLSHEEERQALALRGYGRTIREHTYEERFKVLFDSTGFAL